MIKLRLAVAHTVKCNKLFIGMTNSFYSIFACKLKKKNSMS